MEVLVEMGESRRVLSPFSESSLLDLLKKEDERGYFVLDKEEIQPDEDANLYFIQRWIQKWDSFVNVSHLSEIVSGDKLKIVAKRGVKPKVIKVKSSHH